MRVPDSNEWCRPVEDDCRNVRFENVADSLAVTTYYGQKTIEVSFARRTREWLAADLVQRNAAEDGLRKSRALVACLRLVSDGNVTTEVRTFRTTTADLLRLGVDNDCTQIARRKTRQPWINQTTLDGRCTRQDHISIDAAVRWPRDKAPSLPAASSSQSDRALASLDCGAKRTE
jgi:hypothetical protein